MRTQHDRSVTCFGIIAFTAARWKFNQFLNLLMVGAVVAFFWAVDHGQFDDMDTPGLLPLDDEPTWNESTDDEPRP